MGDGISRRRLRSAARESAPGCGVRRRGSRDARGRREDGSARRPAAREQRDLLQRSEQPAAGHAGVRFVGRDLVQNRQHRQVRVHGPRGRSAVEPGRRSSSSRRPSATSTTSASIRASPACAGRCRTATCTAPRTPEWTAAVGATYDWAPRQRQHASACAAMRCISRRCSSAPIRSTASRTRTRSSTRASTWESADQGWSMSLFGTNLTDEVYFHGMLSLVTVLGPRAGQRRAAAASGASR